MSVRVQSCRAAVDQQGFPIKRQAGSKTQERRGCGPWTQLPVGLIQGGLSWGGQQPQNVVLTLSEERADRLRSIYGFTVLTPPSPSALRRVGGGEQAEGSGMRCVGDLTPHEQEQEDEDVWRGAGGACRRCLMSAAVMCCQGLVGLRTLSSGHITD